MVNIGLSIVQGSGIGPTLYIVMKSDLHVVSRTNKIIKFADDITILVPENTDVVWMLNLDRSANGPILIA